MADINADVKFEPSDIHARPALFAGVVLFVGILAVAGLVWALLWFYARYRADVTLTPTPAETGFRAVPPQPRLQELPHVDFEQYRAGQEWQLNHYGWVNQQKGIVSIPIDQAIEIIAKRGIPPQKAPPDLKLTVPTAGTRETGFSGKVAPAPQ